MFAIIIEQAVPIDPVEFFRRAGGGAGAAVMDEMSVGDIERLPAALMETQTPIHLFPINEKTRIEQTDLARGGGAHEKRGARHGIHRLRSGAVPIGIDVATLNGIARAQPIKRKSFKRAIRKGRKAIAGALERVVGVPQTGTARARFEALVHKGDEDVKTARQRAGIFVEKKKIASLGAFERAIVAGGKARARFVLEERDVRKLALYERDAVVGGSIVHDNDFQLRARGIVKRSEQAGEQNAIVGINDRNRYVGDGFSAG